MDTRRSPSAQQTPSLLPSSPPSSPTRTQVSDESAVESHRSLGLPASGYEHPSRPSFIPIPDRPPASGSGVHSNQSSSFASSSRSLPYYQPPSHQDQVAHVLMPIQYPVVGMSSSAPSGPISLQHHHHYASQPLFYPLSVPSSSIHHHQQPYHTHLSASAPGYPYHRQPVPQGLALVHDPFAHPKPKRKRITPEQFEVLTGLFEQTDTPSFEIREQIGDKLGMTNREVQVWFQNRRAKMNRLRQSGQIHPTSPQPGSSGPRDRTVSPNPPLRRRSPIDTLHSAPYPTLRGSGRPPIKHRSHSSTAAEHGSSNRLGNEEMISRPASAASGIKGTEGRAEEQEDGWPGVFTDGNSLKLGGQRLSPSRFARDSRSTADELEGGDHSGIGPHRPRLFRQQSSSTSSFYSYHSNNSDSHSSLSNPSSGHLPSPRNSSLFSTSHHALPDTPSTSPGIPTTAKLSGTAPQSSSSVTGGGGGYFASKAVGFTSESSANLPSPSTGLHRLAIDSPMASSIVDDRREQRNSFPFMSNLQASRSETDSVDSRGIRPPGLEAIGRSSSDDVGVRGSGGRELSEDVRLPSFKEVFGESLPPPPWGIPPPDPRSGGGWSYAQHMRFSPSLSPSGPQLAGKERAEPQASRSPLQGLNGHPFGSSSPRRREPSLSRGRSLLSRHDEEDSPGSGDSMALDDAAVVSHSALPPAHPHGYLHLGHTRTASDGSATEGSRALTKARLDTAMGVLASAAALAASDDIGEPRTLISAVQVTKDGGATAAA